MRANTYPFSPGLRGFVQRVNALMSLTPYGLAALAARLFPAAVFWQSGQTKVDGFSIRESTFFLFQNDFRLPFIAPVPAAYLATIAEHLFPVLLVVGLLTRLSALALLIMTLVIEIFVFPSAWVVHGTWAACFLILIARGPGGLSLDHLLGLDRDRY